MSLMLVNPMDKRIARAVHAATTRSLTSANNDAGSASALTCVNLLTSPSRVSKLTRPGSALIWASMPAARSAVLVIASSISWLAVVSRSTVWLQKLCSKVAIPDVAIRSS